MICPDCGSDDLQKRGTYRRADGLRQRYQCNNCGGFPSGPMETAKKESPAKILLFDIEALPMEVYVWQLRNNDYISPANIIKDWCVLSWSAKWLFDDTVVWDVLTPHEAVEHDDRRLMEGMWNLLDAADIVIGHNSDRYDHKKLNTRFVIHEMRRPMFYRTIDTLKVAKSNFSFSSNKLDYINEQLGIHQKSETDYELWKQCAIGNSVALQKMANYNMNDVQILEELYVKLLPWIGNHPSLKSYIDTKGSVCDNCGNTHLMWGGWYRTNKNKYQAFRCEECGSLGRSTKKYKG